MTQEELEIKIYKIVEQIEPGVRIANEVREVMVIVNQHVKEIIDLEVEYGDEYEINAFREEQRKAAGI